MPGARAHIRSVDDKPNTAAVSHGSAAVTASTNVIAAQRQRESPAPGAATHTIPTTAAMISPVGVSPASAIQNARPKKLGQESLSDNRSVSMVVATHGRQP